MTDDRTAGRRPLRAFDPTVFDIADCNRVEITVGLFEHESAGMRVETWPAEVQRLAEREVTAWRERHPHAQVRCFTCGVVERVCVLLMHYAEKK